jgi:flagellar basal-body rod modification protein FlgD
MQAAQLTGRSVLVPGKTMTLGESGNAVAGIELDLPADKVTVEIKDANGQVVREMQLGKKDLGVTRFEWDGKTATGERAPAGSYTFSVSATNGTTAVTGTMLSSRLVEGVRQDGGAVQLVLAGGGAVAYTDVKQIL